jgi:aspartate aminotransferase
MLSHRATRVPPSSTASLDAYVKQLVADGVDVVNLTGGEVDFPTPDQACRGGVDAIELGLTRYTAVAGILALRKAIAERLDAQWKCPHTADQIVVTNGAKQALANAFAVLLDPGDEVLIQAPHWVSFPHMVTLAGGEPVVIPTGAGTGFKLTPSMVEDRITSRTKVLLINSPSNPTGVVYDRRELEALAAVALKHDLVIISDEIYGDLVYADATFTSVASLSEEIRSRTITVAGFSKTFAMTGWRVGFAAGPKPVISAMTALQGHTTSAPSTISQYAALAAVVDEPVAELARRKEDLDFRRGMMRGGLSAIPGMTLAVEPRGAFFAFADVTGFYGHNGITDAATFAERLLADAQVAVMPGADFGAPDHVRLSYAVSADSITTALERMRDFARETLLEKETTR